MLEVKVFSATMVADREKLGEKVSHWIQENRIDVAQWSLTQSSDAAFHCVAFTVMGDSQPAGTGGGSTGFVIDVRCYNAVRLFSATKARERDRLGEQIRQWMSAHQFSSSDVHLEVRQSSDAEFHCLTIAVFYNEVRS